MAKKSKPKTKKKRKLTKAQIAANEREQAIQTVLNHVDSLCNTLTGLGDFNDTAPYVRDLAHQVLFILKNLR